MYSHFPVSGTTETQLEYAAEQGKTTRGNNHALRRRKLTSEGRFEHGKTCLWIEPVPRRLRRPHEAWAASARGLPSLPRAGAWPDGTRLRSPHVRDHALLGRRFS